MSTAKRIIANVFKIKKFQFQDYDPFLKFDCNDFDEVDGEIEKVVKQLNALGFTHRKGVLKKGSTTVGIMPSTTFLIALLDHLVGGVLTYDKDKNHYTGKYKGTEIVASFTELSEIVVEVHSSKVTPKDFVEKIEWPFNSSFQKSSGFNLAILSLEPEESFSLCFDPELVKKFVG